MQSMNSCRNLGMPKTNWRTGQSSKPTMAIAKQYGEEVLESVLAVVAVVDSLAKHHERNCFWNRAGSRGVGAAR
jgi:hypothetical protein